MPGAKPSRDKVRAHCDRLRTQGLRPIRIRVPDARSPNFVAEAQRQFLLVASSLHEAEDQAFIEELDEEERREREQASRP